MRMSRMVAGIVVSTAAGIGFASAAWAGQPNQSCQSEPSSPGNAAAAPGSAFNENPGGVAGTKYAGQQPQNSNNPNSVAQYDVACTQVSNH